MQAQIKQAKAGFESEETLKSSVSRDLESMIPGMVLLPRFTFELAKAVKKSPELGEKYAAFVLDVVNFEKNICTIAEFEKSRAGFTVGLKEYESLKKSLSDFLDSGMFLIGKAEFEKKIDGKLHEFLEFASDFSDFDAKIRGRIADALAARQEVGEAKAPEMSQAIASLMLDGCTGADLEYAFLRKKHPKTVKISSVGDAVLIARFRSQLRKCGWYEEDLNGLLAGSGIKGTVKKNQLEVYGFDMNGQKVVDSKNRSIGSLSLPTGKNRDEFPIKEKIGETFGDYAAGAHLASENKQYELCLPFASCSKFTGTLALAYAIAIIESGIGIGDKSPAGARGDMQVMPDTLRAIVERNAGILKQAGLMPSEKELKNGSAGKKSNIACGGIHIAELLDVDFVAGMLAKNRADEIEKGIKGDEKEIARLEKNIGKAKARKSPDKTQALQQSKKIEKLRQERDAEKIQLAQTVQDYEKIKQEYKEELDGKWDYRAAFASYNCGIVRTYGSGKGAQKDQPFDMDAPGFKARLPRETRYYVTTVALIAKSLLASDWFMEMAAKQEALLIGEQGKKK